MVQLTQTLMTLGVGNHFRKDTKVKINIYLLEKSPGRNHLRQQTLDYYYLTMIGFCQMKFSIFKISTAALMMLKRRLIESKASEAI